MFWCLAEREKMINRLRLARNEQVANTDTASQILPSMPPAPKVRITVAEGNRFVSAHDDGLQY